MRKILSGFAVAVLVAGLSTGALAARKAPKNDPNKPKNYDFSADTIEGELARPDGENLDVRGY